MEHSVFGVLLKGATIIHLSGCGHCPWSGKNLRALVSPSALGAAGPGLCRSLTEDL